MPALPSLTWSTSDVRQELALHRIGQRHGDVVIARLHAEHGFSRPAEQRALDGARDAAAAVSAIVVLMELVAVDRIGQEPGEIVVEVEPVFHHIAIGLPLSAVVGLREPRRQREAAGVAAVGGIELAIETDQARRDGAQRNLVGGIPGVRIGHGGRGKPVGRGALAVAQQAGELVHVIRRVPRTVVGVHLAGIEQRAAAELGRAHGEIAQIVEAADGGLGDGLVDAVAQIDEQRARGGEIADVGEVRSLADVQAGDGLRHQPVEVGVALAVGVGRQIDRHVVDEDRQIRAVIEIVAAQIILIGLAAVGVHDHGEAGHGFENLARPRHRACVELLPGHRHLARHGGRHGGAAGNVRRAGDIRRRRRRLRTRRRGWSRGRLRWRGMRLVVFGGDADRRQLGAVRWRRRCRRQRRRLRSRVHAQKRQHHRHRREEKRHHRSP